MIKLEPYRLNFVIGSGAALMGLLLWPLLFFKLITFYPSQQHSQIMLMGFLLSYVIGFLTTAVPRMTGTHAATIFEKSFSMLMTLLIVLTSLMRWPGLVWFLTSVHLGFLFLFFIKRKMKMQGPLPRGFMFVPIGILSGLLGALLLLILEPGAGMWAHYGKALLYEAMILNLIVGLGSRLVPVLTKKSSSLSPAQVNVIPQRVFWLQALALNLAFILDAFVSTALGSAVKFLVLGVVLFMNFLLHRPAIEKSIMGQGISLAIISMPLCYFLVGLFPEYRLHLMHVLYVSGYSLITILISTRVTLAHSGQSLDVEKSSVRFVPIIVLMLLAAVIRVAAPVWGGNEILFLYAVSASCFIFALFYWHTKFGKFLGRELHGEESC